CYVFCIYSDSITHVSLPLSLHDALPISENYHYHQCNCVSIRLSCAMRRANDLVQLVNLLASRPKFPYQARFQLRASRQRSEKVLDRKSTRLNSSHVSISYAVFCLKKKSK